MNNTMYTLFSKVTRELLGVLCNHSWQIIGKSPNEHSGLAMIGLLIEQIKSFDHMSRFLNLVILIILFVPQVVGFRRNTNTMVKLLVVVE